MVLLAAPLGHALAHVQRVILAQAVRQRVCAVPHQLQVMTAPMAISTASTVLLAALLGLALAHVCWATVGLTVRQ